MNAEWPEEFSTPLSSGADTVGEPVRLTREAQAEVDTALRDIAEARAKAMASAQNYMVWQ